MYRSHRDLIDPLSFGPDPPVTPFNPWHPSRRIEPLAQRPGILRPVLMLDPGTGIRISRRNHPHKALHLPLEAPGRYEFSLDGGERRIVCRDLAFDDQEVAPQVITGINAEPPPH